MKSEYKFRGLDHLRALAISLVFFYHYLFFQHPVWMNELALFGWCGVDLFFVLSGFLISNQLFSEWQKNGRISLYSFYLKRAFRILPPYLFVLLIYIFIPAFHERERLAPLWKMFTFTQNFGQNIRDYGTFSHAWSLCVEEQFYLLLPLLLILVLSPRLSKKTGRLIPSIFLITLLIRWTIWQYGLVPQIDSDNFSLNWYRWIYYPTYTRLDGLIMGVGIAALYRFRPQVIEPFKKYANRILIFGCTLFVICFFICEDQESFRATVFGFSLIAITFGLFVISSILPGSFLFRSKSYITRNLAELSYSLYLSHKGLLHLSQNWLKTLGIPGDSIFMLVICVAICLSGAWLMRLLIERPFLLMRNKILDKKILHYKTSVV